MKTFQEFLNEAAGNLSKKQREFIDSVKHRIDVDLAPHVNPSSEGKRKFLTIFTHDLSDLEVTQVERIALSKGLRFEPGGATAKSIIF